MEKFAVDLEKVLNEFEYNEERRESGPTSSIKTPQSSLDTMGALRQQPPLPLPATIYRKPSFERINLADANFAASPPKSSGLNFNHGLYERSHEHVSYSLKPQVQNNRNYAQDPSLTNEININKQVISEQHNCPLSEDWQHSTVPVHSEEKPDLLEYNSTNVDSDGVDIHNQLPDITTSVRTSSHNVNNNENDLPNSLDLISSANNKTYFTSNNQETRLSSDYFTSKDIILIEESDHLVPSVSNGLHDTLTSDRVTLDVESKVNNTVSVYDNSENIKQVQTQLINMDENEPDNSKDKYETLNENDLDFDKNNEAYDNRFESNENVSKTLNENQVVFEEKTKDCISECDVETKFVEKPKVVGFGNDEDFSHNELLEYLESIHKDFEEVLDEQVSISEKSIELPIEKNVTDSKMVFENEGFRERSFDTFTNNIESTIDTPKNNVLPVNSLPPNTVHETDLSTKITSQGGYGENCSNKSDSLPHTEDSKTKSEKSNLSKSSKSNIAIALDYKNELEIKTSSITHNEPEKSTNAIQHSTITKEENQEESVISSSTVQTIEPKSKNPFDQDGNGYNKPEIEAKIRSNNPFEVNNEEFPESNNENPFKNIAGNPFEDSPENPFEDNCNTLHEDFTVSEVSEQSAGRNHSQEIKPVDKNMTSNNSAFSRASVSEVIKTKPQNNAPKSFQMNSSSEVAESSEVEATLNLTEKPISSSQDNVEKISIPNTSENKVKKESASEENPSTDCSPSGSSLDGEPFNESLSCSAKMIPIKQAVESSLNGLDIVDEAGIPAEEDRPLRPNSLELPQKITVESSNPQSAEMSEPGALERQTTPEDRRLGKIAPFWIPDTDTTMCMQCQLKFTVIRRRHHCRACGQVLCSKCCGLKARIEYMDFEEARVCQPCFTILEAVSASEAASPQRRRPNPNNPMEYCSTIPPLEQAKGSLHQPPPSVMVPVSVLKREGRIKSDVTKQVMFSDGIRPGGDLTELDGSTEPRMPFRRSSRLTKRVGTPPGGVMSPSMRRVMDSSTHSFIPAEGDSILPPVMTRRQGEVNYLDLESPIELNQPVVKFALNRNLFVLVKRVLLDCCVNRECWCFSSEGLACVGQDEVVFLLECLPEETQPPKDVFLLINSLYQDAAKGSTVSEMSFTPATSNNLLGSRDHGGFLYIRTSYQCTAQLALPSSPYLVAILVHRWETPWARLFPIRLMLRLGAEFRYYPCPLVSVRNRQPLYTDIGHTIINILADFRKYSYTLPSVRGLVIHMEDRQTTINIPRNRYDQVVRALNNSNDSVLAFGANLSLAADSHLVCMQTSEEENTSYHTQAINIHNKPRKVTGASFVVFNGALKVPGLAGKSSIVEDGLMVQVPNETMAALRTALRDMRDYCIGCGPNAEETVLLQWTADDTNFNIGVKSCIDGKALDGVPSIRVHNGTDYSGGMRLIRWTEVFILQCEDSDHANEPLDISRLSESIARATCLALVPLLDLLSAASLTTLAVRTTIHPDNVGYEAGSNGEKLPPLYMKSLDNELVAVVHQAALVSQENPAILELVFRIMEQG